MKGHRWVTLGGGALWWKGGGTVVARWWLGIAASNYVIFSRPRATLQTLHSAQYEAMKAQAYVPIVRVHSDLVSSLHTAITCHLMPSHIRRFLFCGSWRGNKTTSTIPVQRQSQRGSSPSCLLCMAWWLLVSPLNHRSSQSQSSCLSCQSGRPGLLTAWSQLQTAMSLQPPRSMTGTS